MSLSVQQCTSAMACAWALLDEILFPVVHADINAHCVSSLIPSLFSSNRCVYCPTVQPSQLEHSSATMLHFNSLFNFPSIVCLCLAFIASVHARPQVTGEGNIPSASSAYSTPSATVTDTQVTAGVKPLVYYPSASMAQTTAVPTCVAAPMNHSHVP